MNYQEILLSAIRKKVSKSTSFIEEIAVILDISYDAAHRRTSGKSKFTIDEAIKLCQYFSISMDYLFENVNYIIVEKTETIHSVLDFKKYFEQSSRLLKNFIHPEAQIIYSAKDLPLNYVIGESLLSKFKFYVWLNLFVDDNDVPFHEFSIDFSMLQETKKLQSVFTTANRIEIWNDTTINSNLQQIYYYFESVLLKSEDAINLLNDLTRIVQSIEKSVMDKNSKIQIYQNELLISNNAVFFEYKDDYAHFVPYNFLGYYMTSDKSKCIEEKKYINNQLEKSKSINNAGKKEQRIFFNRVYHKIEFYKNKITNYMIEY